MDIVLSVKDLCFGYDSDRVLNDVSLDVVRGERLAVIGANGAGKSTLFLNLNGVLMSDSGTIYLNGEPIGKKQLNKLRRSVGIVFQDPDSQLIAPTVFAEVSFGPMNLGLSKDEIRKRTVSAMERMGITHLSRRAPHYLSGGEKKCVSIADIIAMEPELIIFDEPTVGLDPQNVTLLERILDELHEDGKTLILSTHDVDLAYKWADRIVVFGGGSVIAAGTPDEVFADAAVIARARLRRPVIKDIYDALAKTGMLPRGLVPRSAKELTELIKLSKQEGY